MKPPNLQSMQRLVLVHIMQPLVEAMVARLTPAVALPMPMALMAVPPIPTAPIHTPTGLMVARLTIIPQLILPTHMAPKVAQPTPMMVRGRLMGRMVALLPGVMAVAPLIMPMVAQPAGIMVRVLPQVRQVAQLVGVMVQVDQQHQLEDNPEVGVDKGFMA